MTEHRPAEVGSQAPADDQSALSRVATLVAEGVGLDELLSTTSAEVNRVFGADMTRVASFDPGGLVYAVVACSGTPESVGTRWALEDSTALATVYRTGRTARLDRLGPSPATPPVREADARITPASAVVAPVVVGGRVWGAIEVAAKEPLPPGTETRVEKFTELIATAVGNVESRDALSQLGDDQAALRRVATLVAENVSASELFRAVTQEVGTLLGADSSEMNRIEDNAVIAVAAWAAAGDHPPGPERWPMHEGDPATTIAGSRQPSRWDDWTRIPGPIAAFFRDELGVRSTVGCPIVVDGEPWGILAVHSKRDQPLPSDTESRLMQFTELVVTSIANASAGTEIERLADEQAALRRVAELVAQEATQTKIFAAIAEEIRQLLGSEEMRMMRYHGGDAVVVASAGTRDIFPVGSRWPLEGDSVTSRVFRTGRPARIDDYRTGSGPIAETARSMGIRHNVGTPVVVEGKLWGAMLTGTFSDEPLPSDTEARLGQFTELMATAIANADARVELRRLAEEQAALRRVATLVAKEAPPEEVLKKVAEEAAKVIGDVECAVCQAESDGTITTVATFGLGMLGTGGGPQRLSADGTSVVTRVLRDGRPYRIDDSSARTRSMAGSHRGAIASTVGCPIVVRGRMWGAIAIARDIGEPIPAQAERRVAQFAELAATAIANAEARTEVERLAEEQAALGRVATLVAQGGSPAAVFDAVAAEMAALLDANGITLCRYEPGDELTVLAHRGPKAGQLPPGTRVRHDGASVSATVRRTERPARIESYTNTGGEIGEVIGGLGFSSGVGAPITIDGRTWGVTIANWTGERWAPPATEERMAMFAELLGTAIANADSRDQLAASRARLVTTTDEARRRIVRDLHDGAQQRLVHTIMTIARAQRALPDALEKAQSLVDQALERAQQANAELRELAHGILPPALTDGGLRDAVNVVVTRLDLPVEVDVPATRFAPQIEAGAYFLIAEALTNVVKHSHATHAYVTASADDRTLRIEVRDDGIGDARRDGHGLMGLTDRLAALGGRLEVDSPHGAGTVVAAMLPLAAA